MKTITTLLAAFSIAAATTLTATAEDGHDHAHGKKVAGPNGGRIITSVEPHVEFFVTKNRKVLLTFLDNHNKAKSFDAAGLKLTSGKRLSQTRMNFTKTAKGHGYISSKALPDGKNVPVVLQIKLGKKSKKITEKFNVDFSNCSSCDFLEYACICDHGHDDHDHADDKK